MIYIAKIKKRSTNIYLNVFYCFVFWFSKRIRNKNVCILGADNLNL